MTGEQMLQHVAGIIAERGAVYGDAATSMAAVAARWSITLSRPVMPAQVVLCLIDLKRAPRAQSDAPRQHRGRGWIRRVAARNHERCHHNRSGTP